LDVDEKVIADLLVRDALASMARPEDVESARKAFVIGSLKTLSYEVVRHPLDGITFLVGECSVLGSRELVRLSSFASRLFHAHETARPCHSPSNIQDDAT
jgi:hypothetical protein